MSKIRLLLLGSVLFFAQFVSAQTREVTGKVTDASGAPLNGASINVKNSRIGTSAGADGTFTISIAPNTVLVISAVGYEQKEVNVGSLTSIGVKLDADARALSEVVVTGTGAATSKKRLSFAVESISADKLPAAPTADVGSALVGKIPGAQISSINGSPGSPTNILLRGINSVSMGTTPLILLDGLEVKATSLESLDLSNIDRIEVVQGPASSTIYGAQGANGVIQLFSKKGKAGKVSIDVSSSISVNQLLNVGKVQKSRFHSFNVDANGNVVDGSGTPLEYDPVTGSYLTNPVFNLISPTSIANHEYNKNLRFYDHYKMFFTKAKTINNAINLSGGGESFDYNFGISDNYQETVFKNNGDFRRTNLTANLGITLAKGLKFRSITQLVNTKNTQLDVDGRNMFYAINNSRPFANYGQKDELGYHSPYFGDAVGVNGYNFNYIIENAKAVDKTIDVVQSFNLNYKFPKYLELDAKYGLNRSNFNSRYQIAEQSHSVGADFWEYWAEWYSPRTSYGVPASSDETGEINEQNYINTFHNFLGAATIKFDFQNDFGLKLPISSTTYAGWDYRKNITSTYITYATDAPDYNPYTASDMGNYKVVRDQLIKFTTYGYLVTQRFEYKDYVGIGGGLRSDYSSAFGFGSKPASMYRGDAYVRISSFDFWKNSKVYNVIKEWKLRSSYGQAGIQPGAYDRFPVLAPRVLGSQSALADPVSSRNANLKLSIISELEIGTDITASLLKGNWLKSATLSFSYWRRKTKDSYLEVDVAPSIGLGKQLTNAVDLSSNGIQASLNLPVFSSKNLNWNFTVNFSKQKSVIDKVLGDAQIIVPSGAGSSQYVLRAGEKIGQVYGYLFLHDVNQLDANKNPYIPADQQMNYEVASNGYVVNKTTKQPFATSGRYSLGDPNPDFNMSFINDINYKGFLTFGFQFDWIYKSNLYNQTKEWMYRDGIHKDYAVPVTIAGQTEAWTAFYRGAYAVRQANGTKSYFMEDASFLRLRNVALGIDLARFIKLKGLNKLQLVFTGRNLLTFTDYTGMDPEVSSGTLNSSWDRGVDHNTIPNVKSYQVGLKLGF
ncbi:MAG: SusC/RagA family TonB-linked outer membrane protein [Sphingobacteriales bacterium]|nr:SusC/RagA family TonB-linked outer membrane protein [Sphingobacteriales bacterium]